MKYFEEKQLVIMMSRVSDIELYKKDIKNLLGSRTLNWDVVVKYLKKGKTLGLFWSNVKKLNVEELIPNKEKMILEFFYLGNTERNKILLNEFMRLMCTLKKDGIRVAPLKGVKMLNSIYEDLGARQLSDIDLLVSREDQVAVGKVLQQLGYKQGKIDYKKDEKMEIVSLNRMEEIIWKTKMNNLPPFYKLTNSQWCRVCEVDCCMAFDYQMRFDNVTDIVNNRLLDNEYGYELSNEDFFIHLCCHLYKEASNVSWVFLENDLNLIKFCDVREFWIANGSKDMWDSIKRKCIALGYEKAVYYSLFFCEMIYGQMIDTNYKAELGIQDETFLYVYKEREGSEEKIWNKEFMERLFETNSEQLEVEQQQFPLITRNYVEKTFKVKNYE